MRCSQCGKKNAEDNKFCIYCGKAFLIEETSGLRTLIFISISILAFLFGVILALFGPDIFHK